MRLLKAELMKLIRPLTMWAAVALVGLSGMMGAIYQQTAQADIAGARTGLADTEAHPAPCAAYGGLAPGPKCDELRARDLSLAHGWFAETLSQGSLAGASQEPIGSARLAAGMVASAFGMIVIVLLSAAHVGGEWTGKTAKTLFTQEGSRARILAAKLVSSWLAACVLLLVTWAGLAVIGLFLRHAVVLPHMSSSASQLADSLPQLARAAVVVGVYVALGVFGGTVARSAIGGLVLALGTAAVLVIASNFGSIAHWTLGYWVAAWMGFVRQRIFLDHLWPDGFAEGGRPLALAGLAATAAVAVCVSLLRLDRADVVA